MEAGEGEERGGNREREVGGSQGRGRRKAESKEEEMTILSTDLHMFLLAEY